MAKSDIYLVTPPDQPQEIQNQQPRTSTAEQAHPNGISKKSACLYQRPQKYIETWECTTWMFVGAVAMALSIFFLVYVYGMPNPLTPKSKDLYRDMVPLVKEGNLEVYPLRFNWNNDPSRNNSYFIYLPPPDISETSQIMQNILDVYSTSKEFNCTECWVENPSFTKPCCYHTSWLGDGCTEANDFGYSESNGKFNPCIFLRFEETGKWTPVPNIIPHMPLSTIEHYDPSFTQIYCHVKMPANSSLIEDITVSPEKGFSSVFFPTTKFSPEFYMPPMVAIQFKGVKGGEDVTVKCSILAENTLTLHNEGTFEIHFKY